jgi:hypothetical protein
MTDAPGDDAVTPPADEDLDASPYGDEIRMTAALPDDQEPLAPGREATTADTGERKGAAGHSAQDSSGTPPDDEPLVEVVETVVELVEVEFEQIAAPVAPTVHRFRFDTAFALAALPFGITSGRSQVEVRDGELHARFGPWEVHTPVDNIVAVHRTGPFSLPRVIGPPRVSLADRGLTFASTTEGGLCIEFRDAVTGVLPVGVVRHPALTVTVEDPDALARDLARAHR